MTKAEERALEYYPIVDRNDYPCKRLDAAYREVFSLGYHQAERDLALSWKDIEKVCLIAREVHQFRGFWSESVYQEVLKRFLERKNV